MINFQLQFSTLCLMDVRDFFGLEGFPYHLLLSRSENEKKNNLYLVSESVKATLHSKNLSSLNVKLNFLSYFPLSSNFDWLLQVINTGLKVLSRNENMAQEGCEFRLAQEGIFAFAPFMKAQRMTVPEEDFLLLLREEYPFFSSFSSISREKIAPLSKLPSPLRTSPFSFLSGPEEQPFILFLRTKRVRKLPFYL